MLGKSQVKYIQSLGQKKHRDETGLFIAEGPKIVAELIEEMPSQIHHIYATEDWLNHNAVLAEGKPITIVNTDELQRLSFLTTPNQVLAVVKKIPSPPAIDMRAPITLVLDAIQDPGNMGTIVRIADWFGLDKIICSHDCADIYNPKVVQATMGSIGRVRIIPIDITAWLGEQKDKKIFATSLEGVDIKKVSKPDNGIIIIGNESKGISPEILNLANIRLTIPKKGKAESLNAAVATGIVLSHLAG